MSARKKTCVRNERQIFRGPNERQNDFGPCKMRKLHDASHNTREFGLTKLKSTRCTDLAKKQERKRKVGLKNEIPERGILAQWITPKDRTWRTRTAVVEPDSAKKDEAKWNFDFKNEVPLAFTPSATSRSTPWKQATSKDTASEINKIPHLYNDKQDMKEELLQSTGAY